MHDCLRYDLIFEIVGNTGYALTLQDGRTVLPMGKHLKLQMVTVGHWTDGIMDEEYLSWDNAAFKQQMGVT